uniref:Uncharacterized protein n=1 Tax=Anopheles atroparvus TaxID=41427 RepID=A0A182JGQ1_ANOAO
MLSNDCLLDAVPLTDDEDDALDDCPDVCRTCCCWCWCERDGTGEDEASIISCLVETPSVLIDCSCTVFAAVIRRIGCEQDFPSAQFASGQPHSSCFTNAVWRAWRCFSISWLTIASTVSAVEISISFAVSGSSSLKTRGSTHSPLINSPSDFGQ